MKLYLSPGACSLAPHIVLRELGLKHDSVKVDLKAKKTADGGDYWKINPKGSVPALDIDGQLLTENQAILQYLVDQKPESELAPKAGTPERYHFLEWLSFVSTELHKSLGLFFGPRMPDAYAASVKERITKKLDFVESKLTDGGFLMGKRFTAADAYAFTVLSWAPHLGFDLEKWPKVSDYLERVKARPAVAKALEAESAMK